MCLDLILAAKCDKAHCIWSAKEVTELLKSINGIEAAYQYRHSKVQRNRFKIETIQYNFIRVYVCFLEDFTIKNTDHIQLAVNKLINTFKIIKSRIFENGQNK